MSKRTILIIIAFLLFGLTTIYFFVFKSPINPSGKTSFDAIPHESPIIIKLNKPVDFFHEIIENPMWQSICSSTQLEPLSKQVVHINTLISENEELKNLLNNKSLILAFTSSSESKLSSLLLMPLTDKSEFDSFLNMVENYCAKNSYSIEKSKSNKATIRKLISSINSEDVFYISFHKGELMLSKDLTVVENAIQQLNSKDELNAQFLALLKTSSEQTDANIFINHTTIDQALSNNLSKSLSNKTILLKTYAEWSEFDLQLEKNNLSFGGFSSSDPAENFFANTIVNQQPLVSTISQVLPFTTQYYLGINLSDAPLFFSNYNQFLEKRNLLQQHQQNLDRCKQTSGIDIQLVFEEIFDNETAVAAVPNVPDSIGNGFIWLVKTKSGSHSIEKIAEIQQAYFNLNNINPAGWKAEYAIDNQTKFQIYKFPFPNLPNYLFGEIFSGVEANWVSVFNNYLIFGDSFKTISRILHSNVLGQNLASNIDFRKFQSNLSEKSNYSFYCNTEESLSLAGLAFDKRSAISIAENNELLKFKAFAWQVSSSGKMLYNNSYLEYNPEIKLKSNTVWQSKLGSNTQFKPQFVPNPSDIQNKDIVLQDNSNILYLINNVGRITWQLQLDGKIIGPIHLVDAFKNRKVQFLFNTENKIYLIDRNGNNIDNFPINLRAKATNGVSVFDYENNKNYRYFIACADKNIYAYDEEGNILDGWDIFKTDHEVKQPIQHVRADGKDFIVASDEMKDYFLNRRGIVRIETNTVYKHSQNNTIYLEDRTKSHEPRFVTTDNTGKLHYTYLDGTHEVKENKPMSDAHFFVAENIDENQEVEYIFADSSSLDIFNHKGECTLTKQFNYIITTSPVLYPMKSNSTKIGLTIIDENKIFLFDKRGELHNGFPLTGSSPFAIDKSDNNGFNIAVGSSDGYLYYYYVE